MKTKKIRKAKRQPGPLVIVRCEDCGDEWTAYARSPMRKCPVCGGAYKVDRPYNP